MDAFDLHLDHTGAEALLAALERRWISDAELDALMLVPGVRAMVDNTNKYLPDHTEGAFRTAMRTWVETRQEPWGHFSLQLAADHAAETRRLVEELTADSALIEQVRAPLVRYLPATGPLEVTVHSVVGGVSDGFVLDDHASPAFFVALDRAQGDAQGVKLNMTHELYHSAQQAARDRVRAPTEVTVRAGAASLVVRLLTEVLDEGTATWVARSMLVGDGAYLEMWRSAYDKNTDPAVVRANFALFDELLAALADGASSWDEAYAAGFSGLGPPLYFVGFEMSRAIEEAFGPERIGTYFGGSPRQFFADFVSVVPGAFDARTEQILGRADL